MEKHKFHLRPTSIIILGFLSIILIGSFLLSLPISSREGVWTPYVDSLLTSTSATCVTGLSIYDTFTHWSIFGQLTILLLIQIGGLGFVSVFTIVSIIMGRNIGLSERKLIMESTATFGVGGVVGLMKRIVIRSLSVEFIGAVLLSFRFCREMGIVRGIYNAFFHSISSFCNAGFDLMGRFSPYSSLSHYKSDVYVNLVIMSLIAIGGLGFIVWDDLVNNKWHFTKYHLHSKIVLTTTAVMIAVPTILFFIFEYNHAFIDETIGNKVLMSFFSAVTPRTAGFATYDLTTLSDSGMLLTTILMVIGGGSGSTAGGMKITTLVVLILGIISATSKNNKQTVVFKRRIDESAIHYASAIFVVYTGIVVIFTMILCAIESFSLKEMLFEVSSAIGTVGLTLGVTPSLTVISKIIISFLMFAGRLGGLTLIMALTSRGTLAPMNRPVGKVLIG